MIFGKDTESPSLWSIDSACVRAVYHMFLVTVLIANVLVHQKQFNLCTTHKGYVFSRVASYCDVTVLASSLNLP